MQQQCIVGNVGNFPTMKNTTMQQCILGKLGNFSTMKNTTPIELSKHCCPFSNGPISRPETLITPKFLFSHLDVSKLVKL